MSNEEINKVIEDKAKAVYKVDEFLIGKIDNHSIKMLRDSLFLQQQSYQEGMKETLSHPTDIGLCRWVEADDKMPEKPVKDNLYLSIKYNGEPSCLESVGGNWVWNLGNDVTISQWQKIEWLQE